VLTYVPFQYVPDPSFENCRSGPPTVSRRTDHQPLDVPFEDGKRPPDELAVAFSLGRPRRVLHRARRGTRSPWTQVDSSPAAALVPIAHTVVVKETKNCVTAFLAA
jgi:hypothetical protein